MSVARSALLLANNGTILPTGPLKYLRLLQYETGAFPTVRLNYRWLPCFHCANPKCVTAANDGSIIKEPKYGAVLIDPNMATSPSLKTAAQACPYGCIAFDSDSPNSTAGKCTMCIDRVEMGLMPICVLSCSQRALDFDTMDNLKKKYGTSSDLQDLPPSSVTQPAVIFKAKPAKKTLVSYDSNAALTLMATRDPLPALYSNPSVVTTIPAGTVGRNKLNLNPANSAEFMTAYLDDEG